ncbi:SLC13 family permease [Conexibacter sp. CPCC 206217]|uniref:SLC13 family permease n=1 Tax=Conexibacter sp. CPCC 206217 TaxID=3064574 RepID=UPI002716ECAC|nr:SLC13 family permease [Conexibacter sp. CPCC 206217]MDO8212029.1 SLC13 family permease [Conexibacter sp. CPCC 206217]
MDDATVTLLILAAAVALFVWNRLPVAVVALGAALSLHAAGVITLDESLAGFGSPTVLFIASLFVVSEALDATGVTAWAGQRLVAAAAGDANRLVALVLGLSAVLAALITPNGAVAALVPMMVVVATRIGRSPSKLLMPLAFSAHAGSLLVLTGSPVNILVSEASDGAGTGRFGFFEFAVVGLPLAIGSVGLALLLGRRMLPDRRARAMAPDLSSHAQTLVVQYGITANASGHEVPEALFTRQVGVAEVVIPPRSPLVGESVFAGMTTDSGDLVILSVQRNGEAPESERLVLAAGDVLLLEGSWRALDERLDGDEVLVVDAPAAVRRQLIALGPGARRTLVVGVAFVAALATGVVPAVVAGLLAAMALVLLGTLSGEQAYRAVAWPTVILIAGLIPVSEAISSTGAADRIASVLTDAVGGSSPYLLLAALFVVAAAFGIAVSNTATALVLIPVALSAAADLNLSPRPVLMSVAIACAASFLTPISTPGNMMVLEPGGYRFGDYWRFGLPFLGLFFVVAVFLVPQIWSF